MRRGKIKEMGASSRWMYIRNNADIPKLCDILLGGWEDKNV